MLYIATSLVAALLTAGDILQIFEFTTQLFPDGGIAGALPNSLATILRFVIYLVGTISISIAIFRYHSWVVSDDV